MLIRYFCRKNLFFLVFTLTSICTSAQNAQFYNKGALISVVGSGTILHIPGNLTNTGGEGILNNGHIYVQGNILNESPDPMFIEAYLESGSVILNGSGHQKIDKNNNTGELHFGNLTINKIAGTTQLEDSIKIFQTLALEGSKGQLDLNNNILTLNTTISKIVLGDSLVNDVIGVGEIVLAREQFLFVEKSGVMFNDADGQDDPARFDRNSYQTVDGKVVTPSDNFQDLVQKQDNIRLNGGDSDTDNFRGIGIGWIFPDNVSNIDIKSIKRVQEASDSASIAGQGSINRRFVIVLDQNPKVGTDNIDVLISFKNALRPDNGSTYYNENINGSSVYNLLAGDVVWDKPSSQSRPALKGIAASFVANKGTNEYTIAPTVCNRTNLNSTVEIQNGTDKADFERCSDDVTNFTFSADIVSVYGNDASYLWSTASTSATQDVTAVTLGTSPGTYNLGLTIKDKAGCNASDNLTVTTRQKYTVSSISKQDKCVGQGVPLTVNLEPSSFASGDAAGISYTWDFGDMSSPMTAPTGENTIHSYGSNGTYTVQATVVNGHTNVCENDSGTVDVVVKRVPSASFTKLFSGNYCKDQAYTFQNNSSEFDAPPALDYKWYLFTQGGPQGSVDGTSANFMPTFNNNINQTTNYTVRLEVDYNGSDFDCPARHDENITVHRKPAINIQANNVCERIGQQIYNNVSSGLYSATDRYTWTYDSITEAVDTLEYAFITPGTKPIQLHILSAQGCENTVTRNMGVYAKPTAHFDITEEICAGDTIKISNMMSIPVNDVFDSKIDSFIVVGPSGRLYADTIADVLCIPTSNLDLQSVPNYALTIKTNNDCETTSDKSAIINQRPIAEFLNIPAEICTGDSLRLRPMPTEPAPDERIEHFNWRISHTVNDDIVRPLDDGVIDTVLTAVGNYDIFLSTTSDRGCDSDSTQMKSIEVLPLPTYNIETSSMTGAISCEGAMTLRSSVVGSKYFWMNADGAVIDTLSELTINEPGFGNYFLQLTSIDGCLGEVESIGIRVIEDTVYMKSHLFRSGEFGAPVPLVNSLPESCDSLVLEAVDSLPHTKTYEWDITGETDLYYRTDVNTPVTLTVTHYLQDLGTDHCTVSRTISPFIYDSPDLTAIVDTVTACGNDLLQLDASAVTGANYSYAWSRGTEERNAEVTTIGATLAGKWTIAITDDNTGQASCVSSKEVLARFEQVPGLTEMLVSEACEGSPTELSISGFINESKVDTIKWQFQGEAEQFVTTPETSFMNTYDVAGDYDVSLSLISEAGCKNTYTDAAIVHSVPVPNFTFNDACQDELVSFNNTSGNLSGDFDFLWTFSGTENSTQISPERPFSTFGAHSVRLLARNYWDASRGNSCDATKDSVVMAYQLPSVDFGFGTSTPSTCELEKTLTPIITANASPITDYFWNGSATSTSSSFLINTGTQTGSNQYDLRVVDGNGCEGSSSTFFFLNQAFDVSFQDTVACEPIVYNLSAYDRVFLNGVEDLDKEIVIAATGSATYTIRIEDGGCSSESTFMATIFETPSVDLINMPMMGCEGNTVSIVPSGFMPTSAVLTWNDRNTNAFQDFEAASINVSSTDWYYVTATEPVSGCNATDSVYVTIVPTPQVAFSTSESSVCEGTSFSLLKEGVISGKTYEWSFDGGARIPDIASYQFNSAGTKSITLYADSLGCESSVTENITVNSFPTAQFSIQSTDRCRDSDLAFTNTSVGTGGLSYVWNINDEVTLTDENPSYSFGTSGQKEIKLSTTANGCTSESMQTINVSESPVILLQEEVTACADSLIIDIDPLNTNLLNHVIQWEHNGSTAGASKSLIAYTSGTYTVEAIANLSGCRAEKEIEVNLNSVPAFELGSDLVTCDPVTLSIDPAIGTVIWNNSPALITNTLEITNSGQYIAVASTQDNCTYRDTIDIVINSRPSLVIDNRYEGCEGVGLSIDGTAAGADTYIWSKGNEIESTTASIMAMTSGTYFLEASNALTGCTSYDTTEVFLQSSPVDLDIVFTFDNTIHDVPCEGQIITATASTAFGEPLTYAWDHFDDGSVDRTTSSTAQVINTFGTYDIKLMANTSLNCPTVVTKSFTIYEMPAVDFTLNNACDGDDINITNTSSLASSTHNYRWTFGDGNSSFLNDPSHQYALPGLYTVTLVDKSSDGCQSESSKEVQVFENPEIDIIAYQETCEDSLMIMPDYPDNIVSYAWSDGSNLSSLEVFRADGELSSNTISINDANGCQNSRQASVRFLTIPVFDLDNDTTVCAGAYTLDVSAVDGDYFWNTGEVSGAITPSASGTYGVTITNDHCSRTDQVDIVAIAVPTGLDLGDEIIGKCEGEPLTLGSGVPGANYEWSTTATTANIQVTTPGVYSVEAYYDANCTIVDSIEVIDFPKPVAMFTTADICQGSDAVFNNSSTISAGFIQDYAWDFEYNAGTSIVENPTFNYPDFGDFRVELTVVSNRGCEDTHAELITVDPLPMADFIVTGNCENSDISIINTSSIIGGGIFYNWNLGDGTSAGGSTVSKSYETAGTYFIELIARSGICRDTIVKPVTILSNPQVDLGNDLAICEFSTTLDAGSFSNASYVWSSGLSTERFATITTSDEYTVIVTDNNGCQGFDTINVTLNTPGSLNLGEDRDYCQGDSLKVNGFASYLWSTGATSSGIVINAPGNYWLSAATADGCTVADTVSLGIVPKPSLVLEASDTTICGVPYFATQINSNAAFFQWSTGENTKDITVDSSGVYVVTAATGNDLSCVTVDSVSVTFDASPIAAFLGEDVCIGMETNFINNTFYDGDYSTVSYTWDFGDGSPTASDSLPTHIFGAPGDYQVSLTASLAGGCAHTAYQTVTVHASPDVDFTSSNSCTGELITATYNGATATDEILSFDWFVNDLRRSNDENLSIAPAAAGIYELKLAIVDTNYCQAVDSANIEIYALPDINFPDTTSNCGASIILTTEEVFSGYSWSTGSSSAVETFAIDGQVNLIVTDVNGCSNEDSTYIKLNTSFIPPLPDDTTFCDSLRLDAAYPGATYIWNTGATTRMLDVTSSGLYKVQINGQNGCVDSDSIMVTRVSSDDFSFSQDNYAACDSLILSAPINPAGASYFWSNGEAGSETKITSADLITLSITNADGCVSSDSAYVDINITPTVDLVIDTGCEDQEINYEIDNQTPAVVLSSYEWTFGNGMLSNEESPAFSFTTSGSFPLSLKLGTPDHCFTTVSRTVEVNELPRIDFTIDQQCEQVDALLSSAVTYSGSATVEWYVDSNFLGNGLSINNTFEAGTYQLLAAVESDLGCRDSIEKQVLIFDNPSPDLGTDSLISCDNTAILNVENFSLGLDYLWNTGTAGSLLFVSSNGTYSISATDVRGCVGRDTIVVALSNTSLVDNTIFDQDSITSCTRVILDAGFADSYQWSTGSDQRTIAVESDGWYHVVIADNAQSLTCENSDSIYVDILDNPTVQMPQDTSFCVGNTLSISPEVSAGVVSYLWSTGETTQDYLISTDGTFFVQVTDDNGCVGSDTIQVTERLNPVAQFEVNDVCEDAVMGLNNNSFMHDGSPLTYQWSFSDLSTSANKNPEKTFGSAGTYTVNLLVEAGNGCSDSLMRSLEVRANPVADFNVAEACLNTATVILDQSESFGESLSFDWSFGDGNSSTLVNPSHTYLLDGTYPVQLSVRSDFGCQDDTVINATVHPLPEFTFGRDITSCESSLLLTSPVAATTYLWDDFSIAEDRLVSISGDYALQITDANGCTFNDSVSIELFDPIAVNLGMDTAACDPVRLDAGIDDGLYLWSTGENTKEITVTRSGEYTISVVDNNFCEASDTIIITIDEKPAFSVVDEVLLCEGETVTLDANSIGKQVLWSTGETTQQITVGSAGKYGVQITDVNGCDNQDTVLVSTISSPAPSFTVADICAGDTAVFINNSTVLGSEEFVWDFGDGRSNETLNPQLSYLNPGEYQVKLSMKDVNGCSNTATTELVVHALPEPNFILAPLCEGEDWEVTNSTTAADLVTDYHWIFDNGTTSTLSDPVVNYDLPGLYEISLEAMTDKSCSKSITKIIKVNQNPSFDLGEDFKVCAESATLEAGINGTYLWQDNSTAADFDATADGEYWLRVTSEEGCQAYDTIIVDLETPVYVDLADTYIQCDSAVLSIDPVSGSATWSTGQTGDSIIIKENGLYKVFLEDENGFCSAEDSTLVTIYETPEIELGDDLVGVFGDTLYLSPVPIDASNTYLWTDGDPSIPRVITASGTYVLDVVNPLGCQSTDSVHVTLNNAPITDFIAANVCLGETANFINVSFLQDENLTYEWSFGNGENSTDLSPAVAYTDAGDYEVTLVATSEHGVSSSVSKTITVHPLPNPVFEYAGVCFGDEISFTNQTPQSTDDNHSFQWLLGDGNTVDQDNPSWTYGLSGAYDVTLQAVSKFGCRATFRSEVEIVEKPVIRPWLTAIATCDTSYQIAVVDEDTDVYNYLWSTGATTNYLIVTQSGRYELIKSNEEGCATANHVDMVFNETPAFAFADTINGCGEVTLDPGLDNVIYQWSNGQTGESININRSNLYSLTAISAAQCQYTDSAYVMINPSPSVSLGNDKFGCEGQVVALEALASDVTFNWDDMSTTQTRNVSEAGTYYVTVTNLYDCQATDTVLVTYYPSPKVSFDAEDICFGDTVNFINNTTIEEGTATYRWILGDGSLSTEPVQLEKYYTNPGAYAVTLQATSDRLCPADSTLIVNVHALPVSAFEIDNVCEGENIAVINKSTGFDLSYDWILDNQSIAKDSIPAISSDAAFTDHLTLRVTSSLGCENESSALLSVYPTPVRRLMDTIPTCMKNEGGIFLDAGNFGHTYLWSTNARSRRIKVADEGLYTVNITSDKGCSTIDSSYVRFLEPALVNLEENIVACGSEILDVFNPGASYEWSTGQTSSQITADQSGEYSVRVTSKDFCIQEDTAFLIINPVPTFSLGSDTSLCDGDLVSITVSPSVPAAVLWSTEEETPTITVSESGNYSARATTPEDCSFTDHIDVTFNPNPVVDFPDVFKACDLATLNADNPGADFVWSNGSTSQIVTLTESLDFIEVEVMDDKGCKTIESTKVEVSQSPEISLGQDTVICFRESIVLDPGAGYASYLWNNQHTEQTLEVSADGDYQVSVTNEEGCEDDAWVRVEVAPEIPLDLNETMILCSDSSDLMIDAGAVPVAYEWFDDQNSSLATTQFLSVNQPGVYFVTVKDQYNCDRSDQVTVIRTTEVITADFLSASLVEPGDTLQLIQLSTGGANIFHWDFGDGIQVEDRQPQHVYTNVNTDGYPVTLAVSNGTCSDTITKVVFVEIIEEVNPIVGDNFFVEISKVLASPNPSSTGLFKVDVELTGEEDVEAIIYNLNGVIVDNQSLKVDQEGSFNFDLSGLAGGVYSLKVVTRNQVVCMILLFEK